MPNPELLIVMGVMFFALFTQSLSGFGLALVSMPLLVPVLGIQTAAPLIAIVGLTGEVIILAYYRADLNLNVIWRLVLASLVGTPIGVYLLRSAPEPFVLTLLGLVLTGFSLYALLNFKLPRLENSLWGYLAGFLSGVLGGAYNTAGPPVILYGNCRRWPRASFKGNLQGFFLVTGFLVLLSHIAAGSITIQVLQIVPGAMIAALAGIFVGLRLDSRLNPELFRKIVLVLLLVLGIRLIIS